MSASRATNQFNAVASNPPPSTDLDGLAEGFKKRVVPPKHIPQSLPAEAS
jgi:hypothetical protein